MPVNNCTYDIITKDKEHHYVNEACFSDLKHYHGKFNVVIKIPQKFYTEKLTLKQVNKYFKFLQRIIKSLEWKIDDKDCITVTINEDNNLRNFIGAVCVRYVWEHPFYDVLLLALELKRKKRYSLWDSFLLAITITRIQHWDEWNYQIHSLINIWDKHSVTSFKRALWRFYHCEDVAYFNYDTMWSMFYKSHQNDICYDTLQQLVTEKNYKKLLTLITK